MAATVESDLVPSVLEPITSVDEDATASLTTVSAVNASDVFAKDSQGFDLVDTQSSITDHTATSLLDVTKLPTEHLVDVVASVVSDAHKFVDTAQSAVVLEVKENAMPVAEESVLMHSKDATLASNISDATTMVAVNETEDTPREDAEVDTKPEAIRTSTPEEVASSSLSAVAEVNPSAQEESTLAAESSFSNTVANEPIPGPVAERDPVVSTSVAAPVAEREVAGELNEVREPKEEEITTHLDHTLAKESDPVADTHVIPAAEEATVADNDDTKKEAHDTEAQLTQVVEDKSAGSEVKEVVAEIKAKADEEQSVEAHLYEIHIQIDEADATQALGESFETPDIPRTLNTEEIVVEVVAPTPAIVDNRELAESDSEDTPATEEPQEETDSTPVAIVEEEEVAEGTETPRAALRAETVPKEPEESTVADQREDAEELMEEPVTPTIGDTPPNVVEPSHRAEGIVPEVASEAVVERQESTLESQPEDTETQSSSAFIIEQRATPFHDEAVPDSAEVEAVPIADETTTAQDVPVESASVFDGSSLLADTETIVDKTTVHTSDEPSAQAEIISVTPPVDEPSVDVAVDPTTVSTAEETPSQTAEVVASHEPATSTQESTASAESSLEPASVAPLDDVTSVAAMETPTFDKEEGRLAAGSPPPIEEETVEEPQTQELPTREESSAERTQAKDSPIEEAAPVVETQSPPEVIAIEQPSHVDEVPALEDTTTTRGVADESVIDHKPVEEEVLVKEEVAEDSPQEPGVPVEPVKTEAEDAPAVVCPIPVSQGDTPAEEAAVGEHEPVEILADKEGIVEKSHIAVHEAATAVENDVEDPAEVSIPNDEPAVVEETVEEAADQFVEPSGIDEPAPEAVEDVAETTENPAVEKAEDAVARAEVEESRDDATYAAPESAEVAVDDIQAPIAITPFQEPATEDAPSVKAPDVETNVFLAISSADPVVESTIAEEPSTEEAGTAASAEAVSIAAEDASTEIHTELAAKGQVEGGVTVEDMPAEALSPTLTETVESNAERSLDESVSTSEMEEADTTTETIIVPEPVAEKKGEFVAPMVEDVAVASNLEVLAPTPERLALNIPEESSQIERPKSPWTPSFQVTTIGHGVSLPDGEEIPAQELDTTEVAEDIQSVSPEIVVEDKSEEDKSEEDEAEEVKPAAEVVEPETASLSWTPSYSVHLQGSPSPTHVSLEPETPAQAEVDTDVVRSGQEDPPLTGEDTILTMHNNPEPPEAPATAEPEIVPAEESTPEPHNVESHPVQASEVPHEEMDSSPTVAPATVVQRIEAESQVENQTQDTELPDAALVESEEFQKSFIVDSSALTPPPEQDGTASPSWVPSYSVSQQGSPLPPPVSLPSALAESTEGDTALTSVDAQEPEVIHTQEISVDAGPAPPAVVVNDNAIEETHEQVVEDRPMTPWTPSYSVTRQGDDVIEETQIDSLIPPNQTVDETLSERKPRRSLSEEMEGSGAFTPTALIGAGVAGGAAVFAASAVFRKSFDSLNGVESKDEPMSPANGDVPPSEAHQDKTFPRVEIPEDSKFNTLSLPPLDENATLDMSSTLSPDSSPISPRKRLESTTSSRLFPGGWFSNTSKIPDERPSLEVAQGVFAGAKQGTTAEETLVSPVVDPITPVREQSSADKRKWCVIM